MDRSNNFGVLRLILAVAVVLTHAFTLTGNAASEPLLALFGLPFQLGDVAVDGFFLISGCLVTKSFEESATLAEYTKKRMLRIYPAFVVAYLLCLALAPFVGATGYPDVLINLAVLLPPMLPGVFKGMALTPSVINGSMWTITYEFQCYAGVMILGMTGMLGRRRALLLAVAVLLTLSGAAQRFPSIAAIGETHLRFFALFGCGMLFYLFRDRVRYDWRLAALAGACLCAVLSCQWRYPAEVAIAIFGGYILFWVAFNVKWRALARIGTKTDLSYGIYLYAYPIEMTLIWTNPGIAPWLVFVLGTLIAGVFAFASWRLVEKPCIRLAKRHPVHTAGTDLPLSAAAQGRAYGAPIAGS